MEPEEILELLKDKIVNEFKKISDCNIKFEETHYYYKLECKHPKAHSSIVFSNEDVTKGYIEIELEDLYYFVDIDIPIEELAEEYVFKARICKKFSKYLSLIKSLMKYPGLREYVAQTLFKDEMRVLERRIAGNGNVEFIYRHGKGGDVIYSNIEISKGAKYLALKAIRSVSRVDRAFVGMETVHEAFESVIKYALNISNPDEYLRLEEAIEKLARLIEVEKYNVEDAIRVLVVMYGYYDIFGS